jgi:hypothetical protein
MMSAQVMTSLHPFLVDHVAVHEVPFQLHVIAALSRSLTMLLPAEDVADDRLAETPEQLSSDGAGGRDAPSPKAANGTKSEAADRSVSHWALLMNPSANCAVWRSGTGMW